ncbi:MAG: phosphonate C-P lyase system protein PhnG [Firmicutes bacterium]|nr:phosphonate C-P lyase system protein PhnG [Bacillota bacterium]
MERKRRTAILVRGNQEIAKSLASEIINKYKVRVVQEPNSSLVMIKIRETSQKKIFYLGEVLVTECKVQIYDVLGIGIIQDYNPEMAYYLAVIDASYNADLEETKKWETILLREEKLIEDREKKETASILKTKVNFETMDV